MLSWPSSLSSPLGPLLVLLLLVQLVILEDVLCSQQGGVGLRSRVDQAPRDGAVGFEGCCVRLHGVGDIAHMLLCLLDGRRGGRRGGRPRSCAFLCGSLGSLVLGLQEATCAAADRDDRFSILCIIIDL